MLIKRYGQNNEEAEPIIGNPDDKYMHNNYVENNNLLIRSGNRRFTRKTNAFSKKLENHTRSIALFFTYYNFCRRHSTIKTTSAIAAGITDNTMTLEELVEISDLYWYDKTFKEKWDKKVEGKKRVE